jgi:cyanophycin synthetase
MGQFDIRKWTSLAKLALPMSVEWPKARLATVAKKLRRQPAASSAVALNNAVIVEAAGRMGVHVDELSGGFLRLTFKGRTVYSRGADFAFERLVPWLMSGDKVLTASILAEHGLPVAKFASFGRFEVDRAMDFVRSLPGPAVVKPAYSTSNGVGVSTGIVTARELRRAFAIARMSCDRILVEEHLQGENYRLTILDGTIVDTVRRSPPYVVGDGDSTLRELVEARRANPTRPGFRIVEDNDLRQTFARQQLTWKLVPPAGERVVLKTVVNGGDIETPPRALSAETQAVALEAAKVLGPVLCSVDLIIEDVTAPFEQSGCRINELNTTPALYIAHTNGSEKKLSDHIGEAVLRRLFEVGASGRLEPPTVQPPPDAIGGGTWNG